MNTDLTELLNDVTALLVKERVECPVTTEVEAPVPEVVRRLRAARLARKLKRIEASKGRAGDNHYKRKRLNRRIEYHKYDRIHRKNVYRRSFATHEARYKRQQQLWRRRISADRLEKQMSVDDYSALLSYVPSKLRELYGHVKAGGKGHNLHKVAAEGRYANAYANEAWKSVEEHIHAIVRVRRDGEYTLDNVVVTDVLTGRVLFDCSLDRL